MNLFIDFFKSEKIQVIKKCIKFTFFLLFFWGIPSFLLFTLFTIFVSNYNYAKIIKAQNYLEDKLDEIIVNSTYSRYFEKVLNNFFLENIYSLPINKESLKIVKQAIEKQFPSGFVEYFLFDKNKRLISLENLTKDRENALNLLFNEITKDWTSPPTDNNDIVQKISFFVPNALQVMRMLKGRGKKLMALGGKTKYSFGYFDYVQNTPNERIAGCLFFLHLENLPKDYVITEVLKQYSNKNFGFLSISNNKTFQIPEHLKKYKKLYEIVLNNLKEYKRKFVYDEYLIITKNLDIETLVIGVEKISFPFYLSYISALLILAILGMPIFIHSYKYYFLESNIKISLNYKLSGYFISAFAVPFLALGILIKLITQDLYVINLEKATQKIIRNLQDIDVQFYNYMQTKDYKFQFISSYWQRYVKKPEIIASMADYYYFRNMWDYVYIIASSGEYLVKQPLTPIVVRYTFFLPKNKREEMLRLWIDRGGSPPWKDIIRLLKGMKKKEELFISYPTEFENIIGQASVKASELAIERYNQIHNIYVAPISEAKKTSNIIFQAIFESEATLFFEAIQKSFRTIVQVEGNKDAGIIYLDVLSGPKGEGWYSVIIFTNLLSCEYKFFEYFYRQLMFYKRLINFEEFDIRAVSFHSQAPNYSDLWQYKDFTDIHFLLDVSRNVFVKKVKLGNGRTYLACVLPTFYLKHYFLVGLLDLENFDKNYNQFVNTVWFGYIFASLLCIGITYYLIQKFLLPIRYLSLGVKALKEKNYYYRIPVKSYDELGFLSKTFNETIVKLQELEIAHIIQSELLPQKVVKIGNFELKGINIMHQLVGGDYFDFITLPNGLIAIIIADVAGHGISAALVTAMAKSAFNILCLKFPENPELVLDIINKQMILQLKKSKMMTCFLGILDVGSKKIICSNAAQCAPIIIKNNTFVEYVKLNSTPLGVKQKLKTASTVLDMENNQLVLYSDGVVEEENPSNEMFGYDRLKQTIHKAILEKKDDLISYILNDLRQFSKHAIWKDDITIVTIKYL